MKFEFNKSTVLRLLALVMCIAAFAMLFVPSESRLKTRTWVGTAYSTSYELDTEVDYSEAGFFDAMEWKSDNGFNTDWECLLLLGLGVIAIALLVASFFVRFLRKFYFAIIPLALVILAFMIPGCFDSNYLVSGPSYVGSYLGYSIYTEVTRSFSIDLTVSVILYAGAFVAQLVAGIFDFIDARRMAARVEAAPAFNAETVTPASAPASSDENVTEELKKLKELLDMGVITQEEFDAKKKQLLGV